MNTTSKSSFNRYKKYSTDLRAYYRLPAVQTSLSLVLSIFVTAFFVLVAIRPTLVTIAKLKVSIEETNKTLESLKKKSQNLQTIANKWEEILPLQKFLDNSIPVDGPRYQPLAVAMEVLAKESDVTILSLTVGDALTFSKVADPYTGTKRTVVSMPFTARITGGFLNANDFFTKISNMDRVISIDSIGFSKIAKTSQSEGGVSFTLTGYASYMADESIIKKVIEDGKDKK